MLPEWVPEMWLVKAWNSCPPFFLGGRGEDRALFVYRLCRFQIPHSTFFHEWWREKTKRFFCFKSKNKGNTWKNPPKTIDSKFYSTHGLNASNTRSWVPPVDWTTHRTAYFKERYLNFNSFPFHEPRKKAMEWEPVLRFLFFLGHTLDKTCTDHPWTEIHLDVQMTWN